MAGKSEKSIKANINNVFVKFQCPNADCDDKAEVSAMFLVESGTPVCCACDEDMELVSDKVTVKVEE